MSRKLSKKKQKVWDSLKNGVIATLNFEPGSLYLDTSTMEWMRNSDKRKWVKMK